MFFVTLFILNPLFSTGLDGKNEFKLDIAVETIEGNGQV